MQTKEIKHITGDGAEQTLLRLYASNGKALTKDHTTFWSCIDVDSADGWVEVDEEESRLEESLTRYANELTGTNNQTLTEVAEALIIDRIKEE